MTHDEFMLKYNKVAVKFHSYYKYRFTFAGRTANGNRIYVSYGGYSGDIYRFTVEADKWVEIGDLFPESGRVVDADNKVIESCQSERW